MSKSSMAALSGRSKVSQIKVKYILISILFLSHLALTLGESQTDREDHLLDRHRRAVTLDPVPALLVIPENGDSNATLFNLTTIAPNRNYVVTNTTAGDPSLFLVTNGRLTVAPNLTPEKRRLIDYEKFKTFQVFINAINQTNPTDILVVTVNIQLSDVNDELPVFTTKPSPFYATLPERTPIATVVFTVTVEDADSNPNLALTIEQVTLSDQTVIRDRFVVNALNGESINKKLFNILTAGGDTFQKDAEYTIKIVAEDKNTAAQAQQTFDTIVVRIGTRPPQFFEQSYKGRIYETTPTTTLNWVLEANSNNKLGIQVKQFQTGNALTYRLLQQDRAQSSVFDIRTEDGVQRIVNKIPIDYEVTQVFSLTIEVREAVTGFISTVPITITCLDENDNGPSFFAPQYSATVREDLPINSTVLSVTATDLDIGLNGQIVFSVVNTTFFDVRTTFVNKTYIGALIVKRQLDYDLQSIAPFYVVASDMGTPALTAKVQVTVTLQNVNDNAPSIVITNPVVNLNETARIGSIVTVILASDTDGDAVKFYFEGQVDTSEIFKIRDTNGQVLLNSAIPEGKDSYILKVIAVDDDSCCIYKSGSRTSSANFTVNIVGINMNKPAFLNCNLYDTTASVKEKSPIGTPVIQVVATDTDRGENGVVIYRIQTPDPSSAQGVFQIDSNTGNITVKAPITRDSSGFVQVTVVGRNPPLYPLLEGRCTFRVTIIDINDNAPTFSSPTFTAQVSVTSTPPNIIYQMAATDADFGPNANITYSFGAGDNDTLSIFSINSLTGVIRLDRTVNPNVPSYTLIVIANDNGKDPGPLTGTATVTVMVNLDNRKPPEWSPPPTTDRYDVSESAGRGFVITTLSCKSNTNQTGVEFRVYDTGFTISTDSKNFMAIPYEENGVSKMNLTLKSPLTYEVGKVYKLSIVCQSFGSVVLRAQLLTPTVYVLDANNEAPEFVGLDTVDGRYRGTVAEDAKPGASILLFTATDKDNTVGFNNVTFRLLGDNSNYFAITNSGNNRADLVTTNLLMLDRENVSHYSLEVEARDGAPASPPNLIDPTLPNIAIRFVDIYVTDVNDNPPSFKIIIYTFNVSENAPVNSLVSVVRADDPDEIDQGLGLEYRFIDGNVNNAFNIYSVTGEIRVAKKLDYESGPKVYNMTLMALDQNQLHNATTKVYIAIIDENDNRPVFSQNPYIVRNIVTEEDKSITPQYQRLLVKVSATDADVNRPETSIRYYLYSDTQSTTSLFTVNPITGEVYLQGPIDRDVPPYFTTITVQANDETVDPLIGYADVQIYALDINDNRPEFDTQFLQGSVLENSANTYIMTVLATDKDQGNNGTVLYRAASVQINATLAAMFSVKSNGDIYTTNNVALLDREALQQIPLVVQAYDNGNVSLDNNATVTILILDTNDQSPFFERQYYSASVSENQPSGFVLSVPAKDLDSDIKNKQLVFTLKGKPEETKFFSVQSSGSEAIISLAMPIDYERDPHLLNFTLEVTDNAPGHTNSTNVEITVLDYNDNAPVFTILKQYVILLEEELPGKTIAIFNATDKDKGINAEIVYSIARASDPRYEFYIYPNNGTVITRKTLDREVQESMTIIILATDKGEVPLTGTATLYVTLNDTNDNAPRFRENYRPVVQENVDNNNKVVQVIYAFDPDTPQYGPPFTFSLPTPCIEPACQFFSLTSNPADDGGNGTATIRTSTRFDREAIKYYYLPIVMSDMGGNNKPGSLTATYTLTITIGDDNDNTMGPGNQNILVHNYEGQFKETPIGRVYTNDPDDWDLPDKTFKYLSPDNLKNYFSIELQTGTITLKPGLGPNNGQDPYKFSVTVYDKKFDKTVTCTVSVIIQLITDETVRKSGGVRLGGITAEEFIKPTKIVPTTSKYQQFREAVSAMLGYPSANSVEIVSLTDGEDFLDVRFSAHASPYVNPSQGESAIMLNLAEFEKAVGVKVVQVPINLCMQENSDVGCYNYLNVTGKPELVNSNGTSYVMMTTSLTAEEGCVDSMFPDPVECRGDYCFNGGTCSKDDWGKLSCACSAGFDGPRCQQRRHSFDGKSVAFYQGLSACSMGRTSIDFITLQEDGLIMYYGPITNTDPNQDVRDFLILELKGGYPSLRMNLGGLNDETLQLTGKDNSNSPKMNKLNDGQWHHVDIDREYQRVTLTVDHCKYADSTNGTVADWSPCRISRLLPGPDILLNVPSLLQLGGRYSTLNAQTYPLGLPNTGFNGCLKNLVHNTKLYDLYYKELRLWNSGVNGCPKEDGICGQNTAQPKCGQKGMCESRWNPDDVTCRCSPGWYGDKCAKEAPTKDLRTSSFFAWDLNQDLITATKRAGTFQMMYRTRQKTGTLFVLTNTAMNTMKLYLDNGILSLTYDMGQGVTTLPLSRAAANSGQWTTVRVERYGNEFLFILDGGEGRNFNYQIINIKLGVFFEAQPRISVGAVLTSASQPNEDLISTCIRDVRYNDKWLPLTPEQNNDPDIGGRLVRSEGVIDGCVREDCVSSIVCPAGSTCHPLWELWECRCGLGYGYINNVCVATCNPNPCLNFGTCNVANGAIVCVCPQGWSGATCNIQEQVGTDEGGLGGGAIAGIVIAILVLLILLIILLIFLLTRKRSEKEKILEVDPDDDFIRENVVFYDEEGAGEEDHAAYDITLLQRPMRETASKPFYNPALENEMRRRNAPQLDRPDVAPRADRPDVGTFIKDRINEAENDDPMNDSTRAFNFEGGNSDAGSLSSLNTSSSGGSQDYDYLSSWGPKFAKLADMYGAGQNMDDV